MTVGSTAYGVYGGRQGAVLTSAYLRGGAEIIRKLQLIDKATRDEALAGVTKTSLEVIADEWRQRVRSSIGIGPGVAHYAEAIDTLSKPGRQGATAVTGLKDMPVSAGEAHPREYASRFEFGSTKRSLAQFKAGVTIAGRSRAARPTLRPAFDAAEGKAFETCGREIWALVEGVI